MPLRELDTGCLTKCRKSLLLKLTPTEQEAEPVVSLTRLIDAVLLTTSKYCLLERDGDRERGMNIDINNS